MLDIFVGVFWALLTYKAVEWLISALFFSVGQRVAEARAREAYEEMRRCCCEKTEELPEFPEAPKS